MKTYEGKLGRDGACVVTVVEEGRPDRALPARRDLRNHSSSFNWSSGGHAPAQLALALIADATGSDATAIATYQLYKWRVIARIEGDVWSLTDAQVRAVVEAISDERLASAVGE